MTQTFHQLPQARGKKPQPREGSLLAAGLLFGFALFPRGWILGFWIFSDLLSQSFDTWWVPTAGFFLAPWTTLMWAWMWAIGDSSVSGWEWLPLGVGIILDLWFLVVSARLAR